MLYGDQPPPCGSLLVQGPTRHRERFAHDCAYFKANGGIKRRNLIRTASEAEFPGYNYDFGPSELWVWVSRANVATHIVVPVWFGPRFFDARDNGPLLYATAPNDDEIASILNICAERDWHDRNAWAAFLNSRRGDQ